MKSGTVTDGPVFKMVLHCVNLRLLTLPVLLLLL